MTVTLPPTVEAATRREFLVGGAALAALIAGCGSNDTSNSGDVPMRTFTHAFGETEVPVTPQRIVANSDMHVMLPLLELGVVPVGSAGKTNEETGVQYFERVQDFDTSMIANVGQHGDPNIEAIIALKPDLIIGAPFHDKVAPKLSEIAPFVAIDVMDRPNAFLKFGELVNRKAEAEKFHAEYQIRINTVRDRIAQTRPGMTVSILRAIPGGQFEVKDSVITPVNADLGLTRPAAQRAFDPIQGGEALSIEFLGEHDADVIFIVDYQGDDPEDPPFAETLASPLWQRLEAHRRGQIYMIDGTRAVGTAWSKLFFAIDTIERELFRDDLVWTGVNR